jgi:nucleotide-binding universal stress UspA family protein
MYRRVVVPLDGSPLAEGIVPFILEIAGPLDIEVTLLRVVHPRPVEVVEGGRYVKFDDIATLSAEAQDYLALVAAELRGRGVRVKTAVRNGEPVAEIVAGAHEAGADLIAMTTHGRSGLGRLLFGSVAEEVLRRAEIPVFLMRLTNVPAPLRALAGARG